MIDLYFHFIADEESTDQEKPTFSKSTLHMAQALFPSMLCTSFVEVIRLLDDHAVSLDGTAVYEVAYQVRKELLSLTVYGGAKVGIISKKISLGTIF